MTSRHRAILLASTVSSVAVLLGFWIFVGALLRIPAWQSGFVPAAVVGSIVGWTTRSRSSWVWGIPLLLGIFSGLLGDASMERRDIEAAYHAAVDRAAAARMQAMLAANATDATPSTTLPTVPLSPPNWNWATPAFWTIVAERWRAHPGRPLASIAAGVAGAAMAFHLARRRLVAESVLA